MSYFEVEVGTTQRTERSDTLPTDSSKSIEVWKVPYSFSPVAELFLSFFKYMYTRHVLKTNSGCPRAYGTEVEVGGWESDSRTVGSIKGMDDRA